jgi:hypothetical protein
MASSSQPPPPPSTITTENPIVAVGRKVKSVLSSHQRPSIRILRESSSAEQSLRAPASKDIAEKSAPNLSPHGPDSPAEYSAVNAKRNTFANRFADARKRTGVAMRALFSREEDSIDDESFEHEYDPDTVDLLDVMGMCDLARLTMRRLTLRRSRSIYTFYPHQRPKFTLRPFAREICKSSAYVSNFGKPYGAPHNQQA